MPIRSYQCHTCKHTDNPQRLTDIYEQGFEIPTHICGVCGDKMQILVSQIAPSPPTGESLKYIQKRDRFKRRNERIMKMTPDKQEVFKKIIDNHPGGKRYLP